MIIIKLFLYIFFTKNYFIYLKFYKKKTPPVGLEPTTANLEG